MPTACFRNKFSYTADLFSVTVTRQLRPKPHHSNERAYYKPVDRRLKTLLKEGSDSFVQPTTPEL